MLDEQDFNSAATLLNESSCDFQPYSWQERPEL